MVSLTSLWLPIVVSVVGVFISSSIIWMALPIHKKDYGKLGDKEPGALAAIRSWGLGPGMYMFPFCNHKELKNDTAAQQRMKEGPMGVITIMPPGFNMGKTMGLWVLNLTILSVLIAYLASHALPPGAAYLRVFQVVGTTALLAYGGGLMTDSIWKGRPWSTLPAALFDVVVYVGITAGVFGAMWPKV